MGVKFDFDLWIRLSIEYNIECIDGVVEYSRQHENNLSDLKKPDLSGLHFVQMGEFYPIKSEQHNNGPD